MEDQTEGRRSSACGWRRGSPSTGPLPWSAPAVLPALPLPASSTSLRGAGNRVESFDPLVRALRRDRDIAGSDQHVDRGRAVVCDRPAERRYSRRLRGLHTRTRVAGRSTRGAHLRSRAGAALLASVASTERGTGRLVMGPLAGIPCGGPGWGRRRVLRPRHPAPGRDRAQRQRAVRAGTRARLPSWCSAV
jgi:hypothetical protein